MTLLPLVAWFGTPWASGSVSCTPGGNYSDFLILHGSHFSWWSGFRTFSPMKLSTLFLHCTENIENVKICNRRTKICSLSQSSCKKGIKFLTKVSQSKPTQLLVNGYWLRNIKFSRYQQLTAISRSCQCSKNRNKSSALHWQEAPVSWN